LAPERTPLKQMPATRSELSRHDARPQDDEKTPTHWHRRRRRRQRFTKTPPAAAPVIRPRDHRFHGGYARGGEGSPATHTDGPGRDIPLVKLLALMVVEKIP
jgi:hypothetical protein